MRYSYLWASVLLLGAGCTSDLPHESPFDTLSPLEKQARGMVVGEVTLEGETDHSQVTVELRNGDRTYSVDTNADGRVELTGVVPGEYRLSLHTRYFQPVSDTVSIQLGDAHDLGSLRLLANRATVRGSALLETVVDDTPKTKGGVTVRLAQTASIRGGAAPAASPGTVRKFAALPADSISVTSGPDGSFALTDVPAGTYSIYASSEETGELQVGDVTVTGEGATIVEDIVLQPLTGFFRIIGDVNGVDNDSYTQNRDVILQLSGFNAERVKIGLSSTGSASDCSFTSELALDANQPWQLPATEGEHTVCVKYVSASGDETETLTRSIIYDQSPPSPVSYHPLAQNGYLKTNYLLVNVSAVDAVAGVTKVRYGDTVAGGHVAAVAQPYAPTLQVPLGTSGAYVRYFQVLDAAGNASAPYAITVTVDQAPPVISSFSAVDAAGNPLGETNRAEFYLALDATDGEGSPLTVKYSLTGSFAGVAGEPYQPMRRWTFAPPVQADGDDVRVFVRVEDAAGNAVDFVSPVVVRVDSVAPQSPMLSLSPSVVSSPTLTLTVGASNADSIEISEDIGFLTPTSVPFAAGPLSYTLTDLTEGQRTIYVRYVDDAGNYSAIVQAKFTFDQTGPESPTFAISEVSPTKDSLLHLTLAASGAQQMAIGEGTCSGNWESYAQTKAYALADTAPGIKTIAVRFRDAAGNVSSCLTREIEFDAEEPVLQSNPFRINQGDAVTSSTQVTLQFNVSGASQVQISQDGSFTDSAWQTYVAALTYLLPAGDGDKTLHVRFRDDADNRTSGLSQTIRLDTKVPTAPYLTLQQEVTSSTTVAVQLGAAYVDEMMLSESASFSGASWEPVLAATTFNFTGADGAKTLYAKFRKAGGLETAVVADSYILDRAAPSYSAVQINSGNEYATGAAIPVQLTAVDETSGASTMQLSENPSFAGASVQSFSSAVVFGFSAGEGVKTLYARFGDRAGNYGAVVSDSITVDLADPTVTLFQAEDTDGNAVTSTNQSTVRLHLAASDLTPLQVRYSNAAGFSGAVWESYTPYRNWELPLPTNPNGEVKTVYAEVKDAAGRVKSVPPLALTIDTVGPTGPAVTLNGGGELINSATVAVALSASGADWVELSENAAFSSKERFAMQAATTFTFAGPDGLRTLYARFQDSAGNYSAVAAANVQIDRAAPELPSLTIRTLSGSADGTLTNDRDIDLLLSAVGAYQMAVTDGVACGANWENFVTSKPWRLPVGNGLKSVSAQFRDEAGNTTGCLTGSITLDRTKPVIVNPMLLGMGAAETRQSLVSITLDVTGADEMQLSESISFADASWQPFTSSTSRILTFGDGLKTIYARYRDAAGNISALDSASVWLDTTAPENLTVNIVETSPSSVTSVTLTISASGSPDGMQVSDNIGFVGALTIPFAASLIYELPAGDGLHTIYVRVRDSAGNWSDLAADSIDVDSAAPSGTISINQAASHTVSTAATLNIVASDVGSGIDGLRLADTEAGLSSAPLVPYETTKVWTLGGASGAGVEEVKEVWMQVVDKAGLASTPVSDTILYDLKAPAGSISLSSAVTNDTLIGVDLSFDTDATHMKVSTGDSCASGNWVEASTETLITLPNINGTRYVSVRFRDAVLNESVCYAASVILDRNGPRPSSFEVRGNIAAMPGYTNDTALSLDGATDAPDCAYAEISEDVGFIAPTGTLSSCNFAAEAYTLVSTSEGFHDLYLRFYDSLGNAGPVTSATIVLDTSAPVIASAQGFRIEEAPFTNDPTVTLTMLAAGVDEMRVRQGLTCGGTWEPYASPRTFELSGPGDRNISVIFRDFAGNTSPCYTQAVTLDTTISGAWGLSLQGLEGRSDKTKFAGVQLTLSSVESDVTEMRVSNLSTFADASWVSYTPIFTWALPAGDGSKTIWVALRDRAGNQSQKSASITLDQTAPEVPNIQLIDIDGDGFALSATEVELAWTAAAPAGGRYQLQGAITGGNWIELSTTGLDTTRQVNVLEQNVGVEHRFRIRAFDDIDNVSAWSAIQMAYPITFPTTVRSSRLTDGILYTVPPVKGAASVSLQYQYQDINGNPQYVDVPDNVLDYKRTFGGSIKIGETLVITARNRDNTLAYRSRIPLMSGAKVELEGCTSNPNIAADAAGGVHVVCGSAAGLVYAKRSPAGVWSEELIPGTTNIGYTDIAVDRLGKVHISGRDSSNSRPRYVSNSTGTWVVQTPWVVSVGTSSAIAVDNKGNPHLTFYVGTTIRYAYYDGTTWTISTVDASRGGNVDIALSPTGGVHIFYTDSVAEEVYLATGSPGAWTLDLRDANADGYSSRNVAIAIDGKGFVHLAYSSDTDTLRYQNNLSGSWSTYNRSAAFSGPSRIALAATWDGKVFISYLNDPYASKLDLLTNDSGSWVYTSIPVYRADAPAYVAVDAQGALNLVYRDQGVGATYAISQPLSREKDQIEYEYGAGTSTYFAKAAQGVNGEFYHAYCWNGDLILRTWDGSTWHRENLYSAQCAAVLGIGINSSGQPQIAFFREAGATDYIYVRIRSSSGSWTTNSLDSTTVGYTTNAGSYEIADNGYYHLVFREADGQVYYRRLGLATQTLYTGTITATYLEKDAGRQHVAGNSSGNKWFNSDNWAVSEATPLAVNGMFVRNGSVYGCSIMGYFIQRSVAGVWTAEHAAPGAGETCNLYVTQDEVVETIYAFPQSPYDGWDYLLRLYRGSYGSWNVQNLRSDRQFQYPVMTPERDGDGWYLTLWDASQWNLAHEFGGRRVWEQQATEVTQLQAN